MMKVSPTSTPKQKSRVRLSRVVIAIILVAVAGAGFLAAAYSLHFFGPTTNTCVMSPTNQPNSSYFTIMMANVEPMNVGFNDSKYHNPPWPVMNVTLGENVTIHVVNDDTQPHGFSIVHYLASGITLRPGECYDATFAANQPGSFTVYCQIFCTIHVYMQDGRLNVS